MEAVAPPRPPAIAHNMGPPPVHNMTFGYNIEHQSQIRGRPQQQHSPQTYDRQLQRQISHPAQQRQAQLLPLQQQQQLRQQQQPQQQQQQLQDWPQNFWPYSTADEGLSSIGPPPPPPPGAVPAAIPMFSEDDLLRHEQILASVVANNQIEIPDSYDLNFGEGVNTGDWDIPGLVAINPDYGIPNEPPQNTGLGSELLNPQGSRASMTTDFPLSSQPPGCVAPKQLQTSAPDNYDFLGLSPHTAPMGYSDHFAPSQPSPALTYAQPNPPVSAPLPTTSAANDFMQDVSQINAALALIKQPPRSMHQDIPSGGLQFSNESDFIKARRASEGLTPNQQNVRLYAELMFNKPSTRQQQTMDPPGSRPVNYEYGSDPSFNNKKPHFQPLKHTESLEHFESEQERYVKGALAHNDSVQSTRQSSPVRNMITLRTKGKPSQADMYDVRLAAELRRGSRDQETSSSASVAKPAGRKRKADPGKPPPVVADGLDNGGAGKASKRRRRSATGTAKKPNLNEDQKRKNHIESEQRRRAVIAVGFANIAVMVPGLQDTSTNKAGMLNGAYHFIQEMKEGNERLRALLANPPVAGAGQ